MSTSAQDDTGPMTGAPPAVVEDILVFPTSFAQSRLWFMDQLSPGDAVYNVPLVIGLTGPLDVRLLTDGLTELLRRHEVLRTSFADSDDGPLQIVRPPAHAEIEVRGTTADEVERAVSEEASRPFDLTAGPLLRTLLLRTSPTEHTLVVTFHHTVCDGWSIGVFCRELSSLYQAYALGFPSPLPDLQIQYADYAVWQRERLDSDALADSLAYWRERLAGAPALLDLPADRPRPAVASYRGGEVPVAIAEPLAARLRDLARTARCTPFMLLLAAYQVLLARYSGQPDICVGTPVAGRERSELESLIGYFANTVVLRGDVRGDLTFRDLLERTRETTLADFEHQGVPFERLVDEMRPSRDIGHNPLFQAAFVLQNTDMEEMRLPDLRCDIREPAARTAKFDLTLTLEADAGGGFTGTLEYATDLFDAASAAGLADSFHLLLRNVVAAPGTPLDRIALVAADRAAEPVAPAVRPATATGAHCEQDVTLTALFERQAARTPHATAVTTDSTRLSYAELNRRANRLARRLITAGAGPDQLVALALPRSAELVVALLAILKSGAAYLPVDPSLPADRAHHMLTDAQPSCVLTCTDAPAHLRDGTTHTVLLTDDLCDADADVTEADVTDDERVAPLSAAHLAYVIYTSGSTGRPKGVEISHRQVVRLLTTTEAEFAFGPDDVWSLFHSYAFDFSVWEIWGALAHGGTLAVVPAHTARSPREFLDFLLTHGVTVLNQTPSAFRELTAAAMDSPHLKRLPLRTVVFGGEALSVDDLAPWFDQLGDRCPAMVNMYGITETTVHVTCRRIRPDDLDSAVRSPIGHSLGDLRLHLLDAHGRPVPRGVPGELHVGGPGLGRGYLGRPALTAERFVPDPFGAPGERLYRSGDLCRWRTDGELEYLGRTDQQVKVRGFRIEPGEIEAALLVHPHIGQAAVLARPDHAGDQQLIAYVVPQDGAATAPDAAELRTHLQETLPSYMVPSAYAVLPELPLTSNGKLDRAALTAPDTGPRAAAMAYEPPRTDSEKLLAEIWADVLRVERVGAHDNFFDLGGHSFSALRLISRMEAAYDCTVPTATIFRTPTLRRLAQWLDERTATTGAVSPLVPLRSSGTRPPLILVHPVGGHVLCYTALTKALGPEQPVHALVARGMRQDERPAERIEDMAADYLNAIEEAGHDGPFVLGGWSMGGVVAFEMARQAEQRTGRTVPVVLVDSYAPQRSATTAADGADGPDDGDARLVADFAADWGRCTGTELGVRVADLAGMSTPQQHAHLLDRAQRAGVLEPQDGPALVARLLDLFRANLTALDRYRPATRHSGPLLLLSASDSGVEPAEPARGWQHWTTGKLDVQQMPGDHYSVLREPNLSRLAAELRSSTLSGA